MLQIGELAKKTGTNTQTLRFYEKIGLLPKSPRKENRYRQYSEGELKRINFIQKAKALGLSLTQIAHILDIKEKGEQPCAAVRKILEEKLLQVKKQVVLLNAFQKELQSYLKVLPPEGMTGDICGCIESHTVFLKKSTSNKK